MCLVDRWIVEDGPGLRPLDFYWRFRRAEALRSHRKAHRASSYAACKTASLQNEGLIGGASEHMWPGGDRSETQIPFGNDKQKRAE